MMHPTAEPFRTWLRNHSTPVCIGNGREEEGKRKGSSALLPVGGCCGDQSQIVTQGDAAFATPGLGGEL